MEHEFETVIAARGFVEAKSRTGEALVRLLVLAGIWLAACSACGGSDSAGTRAHVLLITVDTLRPDYLSWSGYDRPTSPFVDSLLSEGLVFRRAITPIPRTTPALASLMTGTYPHAHGVRRLLDGLSWRMPTLASLARARGRSTLALVSNHILTDERGLGRGFDVYDTAPDARGAEATTRAALERLEAYGPGDDLFVWVHYIDPHVPYYPSVADAEAFDPGYDGRYRLHFGSAPGAVGDFAYPEDLSKEQAVFHNELPAALNAHIRRLYAADIRQTDDAIRTLVETCRERFGNDWTLVFSADHGEALGEKDFYYDHGDYLYNGSLRVPLAIVLPPSDPLHRVGVVDDWVSLIDVAPTLIELLELKRNPDGVLPLEGRSLVPYLRGESLAPRSLFAESGMSYFKQLVRRRIDFGVRGRFRSVIRDDWKLIFTPGQQDDLAFELYDLASDPTEQRDVFRPDHPALPVLARDLESWLRASPEPNLAPREAELMRLRALSAR